MLVLTSDALPHMSTMFFHSWHLQYATTSTHLAYQQQALHAQHPSGPPTEDVHPAPVVRIPDTVCALSRTLGIPARAFRDPFLLRDLPDGTQLYEVLAHFVGKVTPVADAGPWHYQELTPRCLIRFTTDAAFAPEAFACLPTVQMELVLEVPRPVDVFRIGEHRFRSRR